MAVSSFALADGLRDKVCDVDGKELFVRHPPARRADVLVANDAGHFAEHVDRGVHDGADVERIEVGRGERAGPRILAGIVAGAAGTVAINIATYVDMLVRGRPASTLPAKVAGKIADEIGLPLDFDDDDATNNESAAADSQTKGRQANREEERPTVRLDRR